MIRAIALLGLLPLAWLFLRRPKSPPRTRLLGTASSLWMLDHFCVSLSAVLREWPELKEVRLSIESLATLDEASIASLKGAITTASKARVRFRVDGYDIGMARLVMAGGIAVEHLGAPRAATTYPKDMLH
jgi:hypothetical protein